MKSTQTGFNFDMIYLEYTTHFVIPDNFEFESIMRVKRPLKQTRPYSDVKLLASQSFELYWVVASLATLLCISSKSIKGTKLNR